MQARHNHPSNHCQGIANRSPSSSPVNDRRSEVPFQSNVLAMTEPESMDLPQRGHSGVEDIAIGAGIHPSKVMILFAT